MRLREALRDRWHGVEHMASITFIHPEYDARSGEYNYLVFMPARRPVRKCVTYADLCAYLAENDVPFGGWRAY